MDFIICVAKTKALISFAVTAQLICGFVFAYAKSRFSRDEAQCGTSCVALIVGRMATPRYGGLPGCGIMLII